MIGIGELLSFSICKSEPDYSLLSPATITMIPYKLPSGKMFFKNNAVCNEKTSVKA